MTVPGERAVVWAEFYLERDQRMVELLELLVNIFCVRDARQTGDCCLSPLQPVEHKPPSQLTVGVKAAPFILPHRLGLFSFCKQNIADEKLSIMWKWNVSDYFTERKIDKHFMNQLVICQHNVNINKTDSKEANSPSLDTNSNSVEGRNTNA